MGDVFSKICHDPKNHTIYKRNTQDGNRNEPDKMIVVKTHADPPKPKDPDEETDPEPSGTVGTEE